jgi:ABC-type multidrug transport system fused ATPase/permease subunit
MYSIHYNAHQYFLTVDPIAHSTRSSGKIIAKISRVVDAYEDFMDILLINILQVVIGTVAIVVALVGIDLWLGLLAGFSLIAIGVVSILWKFLISSS